MLVILHEAYQQFLQKDLTLLITPWNRINRDSVDLKGLISELVCSTAQPECYGGECNTCGDRLPSDLLMLSFSSDEDDDLTWMQWKKTEKRVDIQRISGSIASTCRNMCYQ